VIGLDDKAYAYLAELCEKPPNTLRRMAYDHRPESLEQLKRWKRRDLIPFLFDLWMQKQKRD
jgi:hypothetical protein